MVGLFAESPVGDVVTGAEFDDGVDEVDKIAVMAADLVLEAVLFGVRIQREETRGNTTTSDVQHVCQFVEGFSEI